MPHPMAAGAELAPAAGGGDGADSSPELDGPQGPERSSDSLLGEYVDANGMSNSDLHDLRRTPAADLTPEQRAMLQKLRTLIEAPTDRTHLVKVIPGAHVGAYLHGEYSGVRGFVARATDVNPWGGLDQVVADARLDYTPDDGAVNPYTEPAASAYGFIEFQTPDAHNLGVPHSPEFGGTSTLDQPFSGSGFVLNRDNVWRPEYLAADRMQFADGARLWTVGPDGARLIGIYVQGIGFIGHGQDHDRHREADRALRSPR